MNFRWSVGRTVIYLALTVGAALMIFPFYWMVATSFQNRQETASSTPVLIPEQMRPRNWVASFQLGRQGRPGLLGGLLGGFRPGRSVSLDLTLANTGDGEVEAINPEAARSPLVPAGRRHPHRNQAGIGGAGGGEPVPGHADQPGGECLQSDSTRGAYPEGGDPSSPAPWHRTGCAAPEGLTAWSTPTSHQGRSATCSGTT